MKRMVTTMMAVVLVFLVLSAQADWTPSKRLTWTSGDSLWPSIAVDTAGHLYLVWEDMTPRNYELYFRRSTDGGDSWTASQRLTWVSGDSKVPDLVTDPSYHIHLVWMDNAPGNYEIFYRKSTDGGSSWSPRRRLTWTSGDSGSPALAVDSSGHLFAVWQDDTPGQTDLYFKKSTDGGATWTSSQRLTWTSGRSEFCDIGVDSSGLLHVVWQDDTPGEYEIYHKRSTTSGTTWTPNLRLTWASGDSKFPALRVDSSNHIHVAWCDFKTGNWDLCYRRGTAGGMAWTASERLTWLLSSSVWPALAAGSSSDIHMAWVESSLMESDIYYKKSSTGGVSWLVSQRLTWTPDDSRSPSMAVDSSGNIHLVWADEAPGNFEIYYKRSN